VATSVLSVSNRLGPILGSYSAPGWPPVTASRVDRVPGERPPKAVSIAGQQPGWRLGVKTAELGEYRSYAHKDHGNSVLGSHSMKHAPVHSLPDSREGLPFPAGMDPTPHTDG